MEEGRERERREREEGGKERISEQRGRKKSETTMQQRCPKNRDTDKLTRFLFSTKKPSLLEGIVP